MEQKILSISFVFAAIAILFLSLLSPTSAYGYETTSGAPEILIDKKVRAMNDSQFYDNIEASSKTFYENDVVEFQVNIKNVGDKTLNSINIKDFVPKYLSLIFYPGTFNTDQKIVEWNIDTLALNETKTYLIRAKINGSTGLNVVTKQTNKAEACGEGQCDNDNASYFIGRAIVPATGVADIILKTVAAISVTGLGFWFRKKARGF